MILDSEATTEEVVFFVMLVLILENQTELFQILFMSSFDFFC